MIPVKVKKKAQKISVKHKLTSKEQIAYLENSLIESGEIPELFPPVINTGILGTKIQFELYNCMPVCEYIASGINLEKFCNCMVDIIHIIRKCESHGISISNLELRPEYIYFNYENKKVVMLYWPINSVKEYPNIKEMFVMLTNAYSYRKCERDAFAVLVNLINRREKMDLLEWEKSFTSCAGTKRLSRKQYFLRHLSSGRAVAIPGFPFLVGRQPGVCELTVNDRLVSRKHFVLSGGGDTVYIKDLGTANGTYVNGKVLLPNQEFLIQEGSFIKIGTQEFKFTTEG